MGEDINFVLPCRQWSHSLVVPLVPSMMKGCCEKREWKGGKLTFEWTGNLASHPTIRTNQLQKTETHMRAQKFIIFLNYGPLLFTIIFFKFLTRAPSQNWHIYEPNIPFACLFLVLAGSFDKLTLAMAEISNVRLIISNAHFYFKLLYPNNTMVDFKTTYRKDIGYITKMSIVTFFIIHHDSRMCDNFSALTAKVVI